MDVGNTGCVGCGGLRLSLLFDAADSFTGLSVVWLGSSSGGGGGGGGGKGGGRGGGAGMAV
jgi:hypothetical protein